MSHQGTHNPDHAVELPARLVFSLLQAAVRVAARVQLPLGHMTELLRTAYFLEYRRRHPRDLKAVAEKLGVSIRTAGSINRTLKGPFFKPETVREPVRAVTEIVSRGPASVEALELDTGLEPHELRRALTRLEELGWVDVRADDTVVWRGRLRSFVAEEFEQRVDGINHQLALVADSVWARFVRGDTTTAGARTWSFNAAPDDVEAALNRVFQSLRDEAVQLDEKASERGIDDRFGITVAITPLQEES